MHNELSTKGLQQKQKSNNDKNVGLPEVMLLLINFLHLIYALLYFALIAGYVTDDERIGACVLVLIDCTYIASPTVNFVIYCRFLKHYRKCVADVVRHFFISIANNLRRRTSMNTYSVTMTETI